MLDVHFKTEARRVAALLEKVGITADVYQILNLTDNLIEGHYNFTPPRQEPGHDSLVATALASQEVLWALRDTKRIVAIKALRALTQSSLKAAKDALEDSRVLAAVELLSNPWSAHFDRDEPQF